MIGRWLCKFTPSILNVRFLLNWTAICNISECLIHCLQYYNQWTLVRNMHNWEFPQIDQNAPAFLLSIGGWIFFSCLIFVFLTQYVPQRGHCSDWPSYSAYKLCTQLAILKFLGFYSIVKKKNGKITLLLLYCVSLRIHFSQEWSCPSSQLQFQPTIAGLQFPAEKLKFKKKIKIEDIAQ